MKKLLSLVVAVLLVFTMSFAVADGNLSEPGVTPIWTGEEPAVITVLMPEHSLVTDFDDNAYTLWVEESCNVDIQFQQIPEADAGNKIMLMVTGGEKLPDVINFTINTATEKQYADAGAIIDLAEYFAAGLAVNCDAAVAAYPEYNLISNITTAEGAVYAIPKIQISPSNEVKYKMWVNEGWLNNLGLEAPTTTEEFYEMLKAFKEQDANGNGNTDDEIPFITSTGFGGTATKFLFNAFVFEGDNDMFLLDADGNVSTSYLQDGWFEALDYCKKLVDEGLLAPESFTYSNNDLYAVAYTEDDVVGVMTNSSCAFMGPETDPYRLRFIPIDPISGPEGVQYAAYAASTTTGCWHVTSYAEDPELCFRVGDFQFSEDGFIRGRFGVENQNWMTKEDYLAANPDVTLTARYASMGYEGKFVFYNDTWNEPDHVTWHEYIPYFAGSVEANGMIVTDDGNGNLLNWDTSATVRQETASGSYQLLKPGMDVYVPALAYTEDETDTIAEIATNLRNYVNQQRTSYIIGQENDITSKEDFIEILKSSYELDTLLEIANTAYARQYK